MKSVVLEGITSSGKTELVSSLKAELKRCGGFDVKELTHMESGDQYGRYLREYATQERVLFHRSHVSEHVLGRILRGNSPFSEHELATLNAIIASRFLCVLTEPPSFQTFLERVAKRPGKEVFGEDTYNEVVESFRKSFEQLPHLHYISSSFGHLEATRDALLAKLTQ
jgi:hypothetical protein